MEVQPFHQPSCKVWHKEDALKRDLFGAWSKEVQASARRYEAEMNEVNKMMEKLPWSQVDAFERRRRIALQEGQPFMETRRYWVDGGDCVD